MSEENEELELPPEMQVEEEVSEDEVEIEAAGEEVEPSEEEQEAMGKGWTPEGVEGKRTLTAEEFLDRQPLYDELHKQKRANKKLADKQSAMAAHLENIRKTQVDAKIDGLKKEKREALEEQDHDRVMALDEKIVEAHGEEPIAIQDEGESAAFDTWAEGNPWYGSDVKLRRYADALGREMAEKNNGQLTDRDLQEISDDVRDTFKEQFNPAQKRKGSPVEGSRPRSKAKAAKHTVKDLDDDAKMIMTNLVKSGVMTKEEYIEDLEKTGYFN